MTIAQLILRYLITQRKLKSICEAFGLNYKYAHAIAWGKKEPSYEFMSRLTAIIEPEQWFLEATTDVFIKLKEFHEHDKSN